MSRDNGRKRSWRVTVLLAGVLTQLGLCAPGAAYAQSPAADRPAATATAADAKSQAKGMLQQARAMLGQGDFDAAQALGKEAAGLNVHFGHYEDNPGKLLRDVEKARTDPRALLGACRSALGRKDYDSAETYARQAEKHASMFTFSMFGDSPAKAIKDIKAARKAAPQAATPAGKPAAPAVAGDNTAQARALLKQARKAMLADKMDEARDLCHQASALKPSLGWWDDKPEMVLADIAKVARPAPAASGPTTAGVVPKTKADAAGLVSQGRKLLAEGKIDDAASCADKAKAAGVSWGLFDDTPNSLNREIDAARSKRDRAEAARLLAEGRKLYEKGDHEGAAKLAYRSQTLFSGYGLWDMGDRPNKLLAECEAARRRVKPTLPTEAVAKKDSPLPVVKPATPPGTGPNAAIAGVTRPAQPAKDANKAKAEALLAEARVLHREGKLAAARGKALEAQKIRASFGPEESSPELVYQQIATDAGRKVESLSREATSVLHHGKGDFEARTRAAEARLKEAKVLAAAFMQDTRPLDEQLAALRPAPALPATPGAPAGEIQPAGGTATHGQLLLVQARAELNKGETGTARRLAEEALTGKHGVEKDALAVLRSIDVEEFNQKRLTANKSFDAAEACLRRKEYEQASAMLASIDAKLLDTQRQARMREINLMPGVAPGKGGTAVAKGAKGDGDIQLVGGPPMLPDGPGTTGKATATDMAPAKGGPKGDPDIEQYKMRQTALFQKMRQKGLEAQSQAGEKFRSGQHQAALDILGDYLAELEGEQLEPSQKSLLSRPVESRRSALSTLKSQNQLARGVGSKGREAMERVKAGRRAEEVKQENVQKLMRQYNALFKQQKFEEAERLAMQAHDLDPDNPVITAAIQVSRMNGRRDEYRNIKDSREKMTLDGLNDAEKWPSSRVIKDGVVIDEKDRWDRAKGRKPLGPFSINRYNDKEKAIERKLLSPVNLNFEHTPLRQVIDDLRDFYGINIVADLPALQGASIHLDSPVTIKLDQVSLKSALTLILHQVHLTYVIKDEVLQITTEDNARGKLVTTTYGVADLVLNLDPGAQGSPLPSMMQAPNGGGYVPTPVTGGNSMMTGIPVGTPATAAAAAAASATQSSPGGNVNKTRPPTQEEQLISLVTSAVQPKSWADMGGQGSIHFHPLTLALVVNQTPDIQEQIQDLLQALRRLQDQSVSVEVRMITVTEDFFERIGVNFAMNILTDKQNRRFEPQLLQGQFVTDASRFISEFDPKRFIAGLTPAGTLTPTLDIPITQQSFYQTFPTYGGYTGGGLNVGLAFLSDIQVFLFMEALQGDTRANVMQAPKVTCYNGQSATVNVTDTQNFLTSVSVIGLQGGQFAFQPQLTPIPNSVQLTVQPVITSDRRFVRINMNPSLTTQTPGPVPVVPVVVPIFQNVENTPPAAGGVGQPVVFTQYIQTPRTSTIFVQTTVQVPDGGTVVMGGLKRLAEARTEYGPPVVSKIPYINRLFKNVGYGRETESLLIMVSVRILVLAEEELRVTGFDSFGDPAVNPAAAAGVAGSGSGY